MKMQIDPREKPGRVYWLFRLVLFVSWPLSVVLVIMYLFFSLKGENLLAMLCGLPCAVLLPPCVLILLNWAAFPWDYSLMGKYERTRIPRDQLKQSPRVVSGVKIRKLKQTPPFVEWGFLRTGISIRIQMIGDVFLPVESIESIRKDGFWWYAFDHHCAEVRSPIRCTKGVLREFQQHMGNVLPDRLRDELSFLLGH